ncbi:MAG TPA: leucyl/phenylalanyl-tRNA--protein transferase [Flavobacteriales bacterium]|nr:leucyl/phenylalanyl-tRNA--protein transferase [Flavobacteriales bacterium]
MPIYALNDDIVFPHPSLASADGLLAVGGDLKLERLLLAYENGIFPWFNEEDPPLWWSPPQRAVLFPEETRISKSMKQELKKPGYEVKFNTDFDSVIKHCQQSRIDAEGTWITQEFIEVYTRLHEMGIAHSVETYYKGELVGGLYGLTFGDVFCGESMFSLRSNASKIALIRLSERLIEKEFQVIDCQITNPHLVSMGAREITREDFLTILHESSRNKKEDLF